MTRARAGSGRSTGRPPVHIWRLTCEPGSSFYVRAWVFPTLGAMRSALRAIGVRGADRAYGCCVGVSITRYDRFGRARRRGAVADVFLGVGALGSTTISHEMTHAALAWARRVKMDGRDWTMERIGAGHVTGTEERFVGVVGRLCGGFVKRATAAGLYA